LLLYTYYINKVLIGKCGFFHTPQAVGKSRNGALFTADK